jgi:hypothetical protein
MSILKFIRKSMFGRYVYFPNCERAKIICNMLKAKSLSEKQLHNTRRLGFCIDLAGEDSVRLDPLPVDE